MVEHFPTNMRMDASMWFMNITYFQKSFALGLKNLNLCQPIVTGTKTTKITRFLKPRRKKACLVSQIRIVKQENKNMTHAKQKFNKNLLQTNLKNKNKNKNKNKIICI